MTTSAHKTLNEKRANQRFALFGECYVKIGQTWQRCSIEDISAGGAGVWSELVPEVGDTVQFRMENMGIVAARVVRSSGIRFALEFDPADAKTMGIKDAVTVVLNKLR